MVLSKYEKQGIKFYRFRSMSSSCDECAKRNEVVFYISEAFNYRHYFDSHPNGKGVQTIFDDGSRVVYRVKTSTPNSPAIDISINDYSGIRKQKIHFIK